MPRYNQKTSVTSSITSRKYSTPTGGINSKSGAYRKNSKYQSTSISRKMSAPVQKQRDEKRKLSSTKSSQSHKTSTISSNSRQTQASKNCCGSLSYALYDIGQESNTVLEFISHCLSSMFPHKIMTFIYIILLIFSSLSAYFGLLYINKCPIKPEISIYLLTNGILSILQLSLFLMHHRRRYHDDFEDPSENTTFSHYNNTSTLSQRRSYSAGTSTKLIVYLIWILLLGSFIIGNVVVLSVYRPPAKQNERSLDPTNWCNEYVYNWALIQIFFIHSIIILSIILIIVLFILSIKFMLMSTTDVTVEGGGTGDVLNQWV
ncbi:Hypothetical protein SRAE_2000044800 [Strongyloides ratti]|uniref:Uncharacterized protein n=1 Tax=Strongyloides ratti TaxID=34506 RepID=A0A090L7R9_STRRB|nr:Hypothetical protein SRAE_2000044800 [Strongyloides ratti]CEF65772.1 Hypothetical protein SRAE_2000044800 [Strongyloides ratti]